MTNKVVTCITIIYKTSKYIINQIKLKEIDTSQMILFSYQEPFLLFLSMLFIISAHLSPGLSDNCLNSNRFHLSLQEPLTHIRQG